MTLITCYHTLFSRSLLQRLVHAFLHVHWVIITHALYILHLSQNVLLALQIVFHVLVLLKINAWHAMVHLNLIIILVVYNYALGINTQILKDIVIGAILVVINARDPQSFNVLIATSKAIYIAAFAIRTAAQDPLMLLIMIIEFVIHASMDVKFVNLLIIAQSAQVECIYLKAGAIRNAHKILNLI